MYAYIYDCSGNADYAGKCTCVISAVTNGMGVNGNGIINVNVEVTKEKPSSQRDESP